MLAALGPLDGRRVADIGCGTGRLLDILTSHGARAVGIDTDPGMLTLAATRGLVARTDGHRLPLADASVGAAVTVASLWSILDRPARRAPYASGCPAPACSPWAAGTGRPTSPVPCSPPHACPPGSYWDLRWKPPGSSCRAPAPSRSSP